MKTASTARWLPAGRAEPAEADRATHPRQACVEPCAQEIDTRSCSAPSRRAAGADSTPMASSAPAHAGRQRVVVSAIRAACRIVESDLKRS